MPVDAVNSFPGGVTFPSYFIFTVLRAFLFNYLQEVVDVLPEENLSPVLYGVLVMGESKAWLLQH